MTTYQKGDAVIVRTPGGLWPGAVVGYTETGKIEVCLKRVTGRTMRFETHWVWPDGGRGVYCLPSELFKAPEMGARAERR